VFDAVSNQQRDDGRAANRVPLAPSRHHLLLAGDRFYGLAENGRLANGQPAEVSAMIKDDRK